MKLSFFLNPNVLHFKQWKRCKTAVFHSLGKLIAIGFLTAGALLSFTASAFAQSDTVFMQEIEIRSDRMPQRIEETAKIIQSIPKEEVKLMPAADIHAVLNSLASLDVRTRGADGIQSDLSIRGGNFDQSLILLNGIPLNDVQTGHHNLNLPFTWEDAERIEILQGPGNRFFGLNAYSGAVNFISHPDTSESLSFSAHYGSDRRTGGRISADFGNKSMRNRISAVCKQSDGYLTDQAVNNTDYRASNIFYTGRIDISPSDIYLNAGLNSKAFGANDFYSPAFPWQYEYVNTLFASIHTSFGEDIKISPALYFRRGQDRFELFREDVYRRQGDFFISETDTAGFGNGIYYTGHNHHLTHIVGGKIRAAYNNALGKSSLGLDMRNERILSNVLGKPMNQSREVPFYSYGKFIKQDSRERINLFAQHFIKKNASAFSFGISAAFSSQFDPLLTGGADLSFNFARQSKVYLTYNRTARVPSFTDLYYEGPTNSGNPELKPETAHSFELGIKNRSRQHLLYLNGFWRRGNNTIDWIKLPGEDVWQSRNLTQLQTTGSEAGARFRFPAKAFVNFFNVSYSYADVRVIENPYISKYVLDYLRHSASATSAFSFRNFSFTFSVQAEDRAGTYTDYDSPGFPENEYRPFVLLDSKLVYKFKEFNVFFEATNITDTEYREISSVRMPGRRFLTGFEWQLADVLSKSK